MGDDIILVINELEKLEKDQPRRPLCFLTCTQAPIHGHWVWLSNELQETGLSVFSIHSDFLPSLQLLSLCQFVSVYNIASLSWAELSWALCHSCQEELPDSLWPLSAGCTLALATYQNIRMLPVSVICTLCNDMWLICWDITVWHCMLKTKDGRSFSFTVVLTGPHWSHFSASEVNILSVAGMDMAPYQHPRSATFCFWGLPPLFPSWSVSHFFFLS